MIDSRYPKSFGSDNHSGVHPEVLRAMVAANEGDALPYGDDGWTAALEEQIKVEFGAAATGFPVLNGAGANMVGLALMLNRRYDAIICPDTAHIAGSEAGAAERLLGVKLLTTPTPDGKLVPEDIRRHLSDVGNVLAVQPRVVSISQVTELGTCYTPDEISALATAAHGADLLLHMDGARLANAAAFLNCSLRDITTDAGVDIVSFGATKNGALAAEALIILNPSLLPGAQHLRRQSLQLASKMRFISAQLSALLTDDLWHTNAAHANPMTARLAAGLSDLPQISFAYPVQSNAIFATLPEKAIATLQNRYTFHIWDASTGTVRWMTAFDTTPTNIDDFLTDIRTTLRDSSPI